MPDNRYSIDKVGDSSIVVQGNNNRIEAVQSALAGPSLQRQFEELMTRIATATDLDEDDRQLAAEKTKAVALALGSTEQSPGDLRRALRDAHTFMTSTSRWAWEEMSRVLRGESAQQIITGIAEVGMRTAIQNLLLP